MITVIRLKAELFVQVSMDMKEISVGVYQPKLVVQTHALQVNAIFPEIMVLQ